MLTHNIMLYRFIDSRAPGSCHHVSRLRQHVKEKTEKCKIFMTKHYSIFRDKGYSPATLYGP